MSAIAAIAALVIAKRGLDIARASARAAEETLQMAKDQREADRRHAVGLALVSVTAGGGGRLLVYRFSAISFRESVSHVVVSIIDAADNELGMTVRGANLAVGTHQQLVVTVPLAKVGPGMRALVRWRDRESQRDVSHVSDVEVPAAPVAEPLV